jgi:hypothetical protein
MPLAGTRRCTRFALAFYTGPGPRSRSTVGKMSVIREKQLTFGPFRIEPRQFALYRGPTRLVLGPAR